MLIIWLVLEGKSNQIKKAQVRKYVYVKIFHPLEEPLKNIDKL
jgi:hypothetical protein